MGEEGQKQPCGARTQQYVMNYGNAHICMKGEGHGKKHRCKYCGLEWEDD